MDTNTTNATNNTQFSFTRCLLTDHDVVCLTEDASAYHSDKVVLAPNSQKGQDFLLKFQGYGASRLEASRAFQIIAAAGRAGIKVYIGDASEFPRD